MDIALITEGVSEHIVIKHIIQRYLKELDPEVNQVQPLINKGKQSSIGGWNEVLKYCQREEELKTALEYNDYIVFQIDTDMSETSPYSVMQSINGNYIGDDKLWNDVKLRLETSISSSIDKSRIIYAICIQTTECWLLPIFYSNSTRCDINNCLKSINRALSKNNEKGLSKGDKNNNDSRQAYQSILRMIKKEDDIKDCSQYNYGFKNFIDQLDNIKLRNQLYKN